MDPILTLENVGFNYSSLWALRGISLKISQGELVGILGPNGSGKSTLIRVMDGILVPQEGEVKMKGLPLHQYKRNRLAREVALVAQESSFRFSFTALEVVLMGRSPHLKRLQFEGRRDVEIALHSLETMQALELAERPIHELSGGEKQRILIARALAQEPEIILLDEPTSFLDIKFKKEIFDLIATLTHEEGLSVVVVSHDIDLAALYCQRLAILKEGRLFQVGAPEEVITETIIEEVYDCPVRVDRNPFTGSPRVTLTSKRFPDRKAVSD
jgi:iron complex transport system ATP-binding protein